MRSSMPRNTNRRRFLRTAASGLALASVPSLAAAKEDLEDQGKAKRTGGITVENGKFVLDATPDELGQFTYWATKVGVDDLNEAIEAGCFSIESTETTTQGKLTPEQAQETSLEVHADTAEIAAIDGQQVRSAGAIPHDREDHGGGAEPETLSCNKSGADISTKALPPTVYVDLYLSDGNINDIAALATAGAPTAKIIHGYLVEKGIISAGALSGPVAAALAATLAAYWGWILLENDGCGVQIKTGYSLINPTVQTPTVHSQ